MKKTKIKINSAALNLKGNAGTCMLNLLDNLAFYGYGGNSQPYKCDAKSLTFLQAINIAACSNLQTDSRKQGTDSEE